jgi:hypothetical protein
VTTRREFITLLGGAATAWPVAASAQQSERTRRIGLLLGATDERDPESQHRIAAFRQGLEALGWSEGRNIWIDSFRRRRRAPYPGASRRARQLGPGLIVANSSPAKPEHLRREGEEVEHRRPSP